MENEGDGSANADGNNESNDCDEIFELNDEVLRRLKSNDPGVANVWLNGKNWIEGAGQAIANSTCLRKLSIWLERGDEGFWYPLFKALARNRSIEEFSLFEDGPSFFEDDDISDLVPFFKNNSNLRSVDFASCVMHKPFGIDSIIEVLSACKTDQLERINIGGIWCTEEKSARFIDLVGKQQKLLKLELSDLLNQQRDMLSTVAHDALAELLDNPASILQELRINPYGVMDIITEALIGNETLTTLELSGSYIEAEELMEFADALQYCSLNKLSLNSTYINDECVSYLGTALANNETTLEYLDLGCNYEITVDGWRGFSKCLESSNFALRELDLRQCAMNETKAAVIFSALAGNSSLQILHVASYAQVWNSTDGVWDVLAQTLCNTSSIESIAFSSNHALHTLDICSEVGRVREDVVSLLKMNKNESKAETARRKILKYYFLDEKLTGHVFPRMLESVLPCAIGWVCRDHHGFSTMYNLLRCLPSIVSNSSYGLHTSGAKKRKLCVAK